MGKDQDLIEASRNGDIAIVEKILISRAKRGPLASLRRGPGANAQDSQGLSALHHAAVNKHRDIVELLLSHEASTNIVDHQGSSPLHLAAWSGDVQIVLLLLTHGPSVPNVNLMNQASETALHMASQYGHVEVVKALLQHGADPVITNSRQETSLDLASQYGRLDTVQLLLKSHPALLAPYTSSTPTGKPIFPHTPLHLASRNGHRGTVEILVKAGFNVNSRTSQGTALHEAAICGKVDVVKALLDAGIDVCVTDNQRRTAVDAIMQFGPGLKTPVSKDIAELIRGALKRSHMQSGKNSSPLCSPHESVPTSQSQDNKLPLSQIFDNYSHNDAADSTNVRHSYSPRQSPKANSFNRGKTRRSMDAYMPKGPDFDTPTAPPKKPPRRNLSASPTHPGADFLGDNYDLVTFGQMGRNKSLDESVYGERWRKSVATCYETSHSTDSIDISLSDHHKSCSKSDIASFNGLVVEELKSKSKSQHQGLDSNFVSVAHIKLRDAKSEQNVSPGGLEKLEIKILDDVDNSSQLPFNNNVIHTTSNGKTSQPKGVNVKEVPKTIVPLGPKPTIAPKPIIAPKPKIIKRQGHSCDNVVDDHSNKKRGGTPRKGTHKSTSMNLSPVDVDKEWESITKFMDSLSVKMGDVKIGGDGENSVHTVGAWLATLSMEQYGKLLLTNGFDDTEFLGEDILDENSLLDIGMLNAQHRKIVTEAASRLDVNWPRAIGANGVPVSVEKWLQELHLKDHYAETFRKNLYTDPERLLRLWNDELTTVLDINVLGHRRRILAASSRASGLSRRVSSSPRLENGIEIDETQSDGSLPYRDPNDLLSGVSTASGLWRHAPETLIDGSVSYKAIYVGSSFVQEFSTTNLIQGAIQRIRSLQPTTNGESQNSDKTTTTVFNINVTLIVSATVVSWYNTKTKSLVREHEIGSIQCTCQASDDLRHLALVTKAADPGARSHSCHVFRLDSVDVATEAILTLGQAFEVAYQLAVNRSHNKDHKGHMRSKSANQLSTNTTTTPPIVAATACAKLKKDKYQSHIATNNHCRSQSVNDIPPPTVLAVSKSTTNSPQIHPHNKDYRFPRAESFSFSSHSNLSRAPIVSKEEL